MDFSSSDLMSGALKCIFSGFLELMNSFTTSAMRSLKGRLSFISYMFVCFIANDKELLPLIG